MNREGNPQWVLGKYPLANHFQADIDNNALWVAILIDDEVAAVPAKVVGVAALTTDQSLYGSCLDIEQSAIIPHRVAVSPDYQKLGIAKALIHKAEEISRDVGYGRVRIDTHINNPSMKRTLKSLNYSLIADITKPTKFPVSEKFSVFEKVLK